MIDDDSRHAALKNNYGGNAGFFKAAIDIYMHGLIAKTQETQQAQMTCYAGTAGGVIFNTEAEEGAQALARAAVRLAATLSRKPSVVSQPWVSPTSSARSLVIEPASTVSTQTFSSVLA